MKVLSYVKGMDGCSYHRIYLPNQTITENRVVSQLSKEDLQWCDILHYSRHVFEAPEFLRAKAKEYGFKIVVDTDDWWEEERTTRSIRCGPRVMCPYRSGST